MNTPSRVTHSHRCSLDSLAVTVAATTQPLVAATTLGTFESFFVCVSSFLCLRAHSWWPTAPGRAVTHWPKLNETIDLANHFSNLRDARRPPGGPGGSSRGDRPPGYEGQLPVCCSFSHNARRPPGVCRRGRGTENCSFATDTGS